MRLTRVHLPVNEKHEYLDKYARISNKNEYIYMYIMLVSMNKSVLYTAGIKGPTLLLFRCLHGLFTPQ